ncbi:hypothetical protein HPP92_016055 [Vanilla planifolia]|uniref:Uncharacterized protein n=1 Tax=Vanilla planifolia TaxID=51239 RepID=A0A835QTC3_VANPL|nr:hypothetical protein HPP92_016055 [Vanilla planifolia]
MENGLNPFSFKRLLDGASIRVLSYSRALNIKGGLIFEFEAQWEEAAASSKKRHVCRLKKSGIVFGCWLSRNRGANDDMRGAHKFSKDGSKQALLNIQLHEDDLVGNLEKYLGKHCESGCTNLKRAYRLCRMFREGTKVDE